MAGSGTSHLREDHPDIMLRVENLEVHFGSKRKGIVHAVCDVSFDVADRETLGIVGESGCGKTTTARAVMQLAKVTGGSVDLRGVRLTDLEGTELRRARQAMQMIFQDPISSLNPRRKVKEIVREGLEIWGQVGGAFTGGRVDEILLAVGLDPDQIGERRPGQFSGGQCQRISIARALVMDPHVLLLDEPVSALDVSVQAQILNLLEELKERFGLTMVFVSHDLAVVKNISDRVMVMYLGKVCEVAETDLLFGDPSHPYTKALLASIPGQDLGLPPAEELISGELPSPLDPPSGCRFRTRCPNAFDRCSVDEPELKEIASGHSVACHLI